MDDCIFCKIAAGAIPCQKVFEDDRVLAFHDINPQAPVHVLLIPKMHIDGLDKLLPEHVALGGHMLLIASQLAQTLGLSDGFRLVSNAGVHGGQTVRHLHFHLLGGKQLPLTMA